LETTAVLVHVDPQNSPFVVQAILTVCSVLIRFVEREINETLTWIFTPMLALPLLSPQLLFV
jgi:hypothetical protein